MIDVLGPEKRRRRTTQEKIAIVQQSFEPGMTVSLVARQHGVAASQLFLWRKQYQEGSLTAVAAGEVWQPASYFSGASNTRREVLLLCTAGEQVVPASELAAAMKQIKELQRLLGKKTMENELLKEAVEYGRAKKVDSARALIARGWGVSLVSRCLRVSRAQLHVILRRTDDWMDGRRSRHTDDTDVLLRIHHVIGELPTYGYRRVWALLRRQAELDGMPAINAKRVYRIMRQNALLLERKPAVPPSKRAHTGRVAVKESNQRWCSDGFEFCCDNGERLRVTFALDCCDREALHWAVTTGGFNSETVQDVMLGAVERRFGNDLPSSSVEWLTDNGSCYRANETRQFARMLGLEPKNTAVRSPESNGIAESFVKTIKRDYISIMPKPDGLTAAKNLAEAFEHYNEWHPHSALGYRSPREYLRQRACNGLSDNRCLEI
ncbi:IS3 family transposase [Escherichia coli]|nr:IS3 family transposase [Escherichia coli]